MGTEELRHAVTDGAAGVAWVVVPPDREQARALRRQCRSVFWCSTAAGGCGARLSLHAGAVKVPHLQHYPGEAESCPFAAYPDAAARSYLHLALQHGLHAWLAGQGYQARLESTLPDRSRADLKVTVAGLTHTIEVQLSPLTVGDWTRRDTGYLAQVDQVSWLFGPRISARLRRAHVQQRGYALHVELAASSTRHEPADLSQIRIGTEDHDACRWSPLTACTMTPTGIRTPFTDAAAGDHQDWLQRRELLARAATGARRLLEKRRAEAERARPVRYEHTVVPIDEDWIERERERRREQEEAREQKRLARLAAEAERAAQRARQEAMERAHRAQWEALDRADRARWEAEERERLARATTRQRGAGRLPLTDYDWAFERFADWAAPDGLLDQVPSHLHHAVKMMAYIVTCIESTGPAARLAFPDVDDGGAIRDALVDTSLIELYEAMGVPRWRRTENHGGQAYGDSRDEEDA